MTRILRLLFWRHLCLCGCRSSSIRGESTEAEKACERNDYNDRGDYCRDGNLLFQKLISIRRFGGIWEKSQTSAGDANDAQQYLRLEMAIAKKSAYTIYLI